MVNMEVIVREASELRMPVGFWPSDIKCPECGKNAPELREIRDGENECQGKVYMCIGCEREVHVLND